MGKIIGRQPRELVDRLAIPHAAGKIEPPMGPTKAKERSSQAQSIERVSQLHVTAGCTLPATVRLDTTLSIPASPAHQATLPGSIPPLAVLNQYQLPLHQVRPLALAPHGG